MEPYDWTCFKKRVNINASPGEIYQLWSTPAGMEQWFLKSCKINSSTGFEVNQERPIVEGDRYVWHWHGYPDDVKEEGIILEANGETLFKFTFGPVENNMFCTVNIFEEEGETICSIAQENIPTDDKGKSAYHVGCQTGWSFYLANLKSILEGGIDLRNKNLLLKDMINS